MRCGEGWEGNRKGKHESVRSIRGWKGGITCQRRLKRYRLPKSVAASQQIAVNGFYAFQVNFLFIGSVVAIVSVCSVSCHIFSADSKQRHEPSGPPFAVLRNLVECLASFNHFM